MSTSQYPQKDNDTSGHRYGPLKIGLGGAVPTPPPPPAPTSQKSTSRSEYHSQSDCEVKIECFLNPDAIYLGYVYSGLFVDYPLKNTTLDKFRERVESEGRTGYIMERTTPEGFDFSQLKLQNVWIRAQPLRKARRKNRGRMCQFEMMRTFTKF